MFIKRCLKEVIRRHYFVFNPLFVSLNSLHTSIQSSPFHRGHISVLSKLFRRYMHFCEKTNFQDDSWSDKHSSLALSPSITDVVDTVDWNISNATKQIHKYSRKVLKESTQGKYSMKVLKESTQGKYSRKVIKESNKRKY